MPKVNQITMSAFVGCMATLICCIFAPVFGYSLQFDHQIEHAQAAANIAGRACVVISLILGAFSFIAVIARRLPLSSSTMGVFVAFATAFLVGLATWQSDIDPVLMIGFIAAIAGTLAFTMACADHGRINWQHCGCWFGVISVPPFAALGAVMLIGAGPFLVLTFLTWAVATYLVFGIASWATVAFTAPLPVRVTNPFEDEVAQQP